MAEIIGPSWPDVPVDRRASLRARWPPSSARPCVRWPSTRRHRIRRGRHRIRCERAPVLYRSHLEVAAGVIRVSQTDCHVAKQAKTRTLAHGQHDRFREPLVGGFAGRRFADRSSPCPATPYLVFGIRSIHRCMRGLVAQNSLLEVCAFGPHPIRCRGARALGQCRQGQVEKSLRSRFASCSSEPRPMATSSILCARPRPVSDMHVFRWLAQHGKRGARRGEVHMTCLDVLIVFDKRRRDARRHLRPVRVLSASGWT